MKWGEEYERLETAIQATLEHYLESHTALGEGHSRKAFLVKTEHGAVVHKIPLGVENIDQNLGEAAVYAMYKAGLGSRRPCAPAPCRMIDELVLEMDYYSTIYDEEGWQCPKDIPSKYDFIRAGEGSDRFQGAKDRSGQWRQIDYGMYPRQTNPFLLQMVHPSAAYEHQMDYVWPEYGIYKKWFYDEDAHDTWKGAVVGSSTEKSKLEEELDFDSVVLQIGDGHDGHAAREPAREIKFSISAHDLWFGGDFKLPALPRALLYQSSGVPVERSVHQAGVAFDIALVQSSCFIPEDL